MDSATVPKPRRRWFLWGLAVLLLGTGVAVAVVEGPLWSELSFAAEETFPTSDQWDAKYIRVDIYHNLIKYRPEHLARYLHSPSERWRGIVCLVLRGHQDRDPDHWRGVPERLVQTAVSASNPGLRKLCLHGFRAVPRFSEEDVKSVLSLLSAHDIPETGEMVDVLAVRGAEAAPLLQSTLEEWLRGPSPGRRNVAFRTAVSHFPALDDAAAAQVRAVFANDTDDAKPWRLLHTLLDRKPEVGEGLVKSSPSDCRIVWKALALRIEGQRTDGPLLLAADAAAVKELAGGAADRGTLIDYLLNRPHGLNQLFRGLNGRDDGFVAAVFEKLPPSSVAANPRRFEPLDVNAAETFVAVFPRLRGPARERWGEWLSTAGRPGGGSLFPAQAGPNSPRHADAFALLLADEHTAPWVASYFERVAPLPTAEVGRIVGMLRRGLKEFEGPPPPLRPFAMAPAAMGGAGGERVMGMTPAAVTAAHFRLAAALRKQHASHPDVVAFFKDFPRVVGAGSTRGRG